jgi:DnaJ like chaperone protein
MYRRQTTVNVEQHHYEVLGLQDGVDFVEIKQAYRKLSMKYHPDKVAHLGEEFKGVAEEKMKEINAAYQYFKKKFS